MSWLASWFSGREDKWIAKRKWWAENGGWWWFSAKLVVRMG
ncbi:uncharacterized protein G2W53_033843 [Senna tora]|uniref:Uncharacterized protein n=1 Tax=Senna tora TaxID=362788 RepID=A0A834T300_9FABA|nr:uncharacterized protein G2W53_033843 [Senna tora]